MGDQMLEVNPLLIHEGEELILCDAGYPNQLDQIESQLKQWGFKLGDLTKVFISHHDHDHIGSLGALCDRCPEVKIVTSQLEKPYIDGSEKALRLIQAEKYNESLDESEKAFGIGFVNYLKTINTVEIDGIVSEGDYLAKGVKVIATPGHTPGHQSILLEDESFLFAGDALAIEKGALVIANPEFTLDREECVKSIKKISQMNLSQLLCYHGGIIKNSLEQSLNQLLETL